MINKILSVSLCFLAPAVAAQAPFKVVGEQIDFAVPSYAKLAFMQGTPAGEYQAEYVDKSESVESWKKFFIGYKRINQGDFKQLVAANVKALPQLCSNLTFSKFYRHKDPFYKAGDIISWVFFCADKMPNAPYGEGTVMTFLQGEDFLFQHWSAWRPTSADLGANNLGIDKQRLAQLIRLGGTVNLCNKEAGKKCYHNNLQPE
ncbi:hypothetical protein EDC45_0497 [Mesocricetibacter intestinalis]|uniref:Chalcone isomerase-like protein n=1 Tax=Mesocricetibacter intestinalis TaxID=1521930 RepID=A0A4R6VFR1_9PAST|nr:hypothetical protein [Mesocricetibacter intestinalis]TDQ59835.1 hypothetical protein EDC45_0497 [Mesocricetibacter intestinalis]